MADERWQHSGLRPDRIHARALGLAALTLLAAGVLLGAIPAGARAQTQPVAMAPVVIDGPSAPGAGPRALTSSIARDGTGALAYLKLVGGTPHVFVSALLGGTFQPPVQIDGTLPGASSPPLVAAGPDGALVVAFLNGTGLYVAQRPNALHGLSPPRRLVAAAGHPALGISPSGKAYLAFTVPDGAGSDVRVAYDASAGWAIESAPLNLTRADSAGTGTGPPAVAVAGDGVAIVAWGEAGQVITRRVWGTTPSVVAERADAPLPYCQELAADEPVIGTGGDSSYAAVAFHETMTCGASTQSRVLVNRLHGSRYDGVAAADGPLGSAPGGTDHPAGAVGEYGSGWVTSETVSDDVDAMPLAQGDYARTGARLNALSNASRPYATPTMAGLYATVIAWQHDPGGGDALEIRARYADSGAALGSEFVLSDPAAGPTDAAAGLTAGGDILGDAMVAWVQSAAAGDELVTDELLRGPGGPVPTPQPGYQRSTQPTLAWAPALEPWGSVRYTVSVDGHPLGQTLATSIAIPTPLAQGRHSWQVDATNQAGLDSGPQTGTFFIDTLAPVVRLALPRRGAPGRAVALVVTATDHPPPLSPGEVSGVAATVVRWGDGTVTLGRGRRRHVYRRPGRYRVTVVVLDRAANATVESALVRIVAPPKPKPKRTKPTKPTGGARG